MITLLKNLGPILVLVGVVLLAVYAFGVPANALLVAGLGTQVAGLVALVVLNKRTD